MIFQEKNVREQKDVLLETYVNKQCMFLKGHFVMNFLMVKLPLVPDRASCPRSIVRYSVF